MNKYEALFRITRQGGVLTITDKTSLPPTGRGGRPPRRKRNEDASKGNIMRGVHRSLNSLIQTLQHINITDDPHYFLSLVNDRRVSQEQEVEVFKNAVRRFVRRVNYRYPGAYYVIVYGWSAETNTIHAHIATDLGQVSPRKPLATNRELGRLWMDVIGSTNYKTFKLSLYDRNRHISYLSTEKRQHELSVLLHRLNGGKAWTVVNGKNLRKAEPETLYIHSKVEREQFNQILIGLMREAGVHTSNFGRIQKNNTCANYLGEKLLRSAFVAFRAWRATQ